MEILAPAGSMSQAVSAITAGCDALYGGLKQWSARNRAENFTIEEYNQLISLCHAKNVRFYLTINTLLKNDEIVSIFELLSSGQILFPDAIIAADIGFIMSIRERYPDISVHVSTQFGTTNLDDIRFLESIGVKRAILARELLLSEIEHICENTSMEIEVFAYGSQCVALSGQCLWGGLLSGASGNRGRCIGMCRDLYRCDDKIGQFLYPQDINAVSILDRLRKIGVHSVKIEGRMRSKDEIASVVSAFKSHSLRFDDNDYYTGFLSNAVPVSNMFHAVNPRTKSFDNTVEMTENDLLIDNNNNTYVFGNSDKCSKNVSFVKNTHTKPISTEQINLSIKAFVSDQKLVKIDYINTHGERKLFYLSNVYDDIASVVDLYDIFSHKLIGNLYEFTSDASDNSIVKFSTKELTQIIGSINKSCMNQKIYTNEYFPKLERNFSVVTDYADKIKYYRKAGADKIIYNIVNCEDLKKVVLLSNEIKNIYFRLPLVDFNNCTSDIIQLLQGESIVMTKLSQLQYIKKYDFQDVIADYTMNLWNTQAIEYLKQNGVTQFIYHPELSYEYNYALSKSTGSTGYAISYGKLPVGYTRGCFGECGLCDCNNSSSFTLDNISKGYSVQVLCHNAAGYRSIMPCKAFSCAHELDKEVNKIFIESTPHTVDDADTFKIYNRSVK